MRAGDVLRSWASDCGHTLRRAVRRPAGGVGEAILRAAHHNAPQGALHKAMRRLRKSTSGKYVLRSQR